VDWARLQTEPFGAFHHDVVIEYQLFFKKLQAKGIKIMFVLHHFTNPTCSRKKEAGYMKKMWAFSLIISSNVFSISENMLAIGTLSMSLMYMLYVGIC
jgi:hypothetical protein